MDTLNEIAYSILNKLVGGRSTHNEYISLEQIKYNIENYRVLFLRRELRESHDLRNFEQRLAIDLERVQEGKLPGDIKFLLKSEKQIPQLLRTKFQIPANVTNSSGTKTYPLMYYYRRFLANRYTSDEVYGYMLDNHLYLTGDKLSRHLQELVNEEEANIVIEADFFDIDDVVFRGVFEKPSEAMILNNIDPIDVGDQPYPLTKDYVQRITEGLINGELRMLATSPNDTKHNSLPDHQVAGTQQQ